MLHTETVEPGTLALLKKLSDDAALKNFDLAGGTALSLQLGHRKSIDLDFFSGQGFDVGAIEKHLATRHNGSAFRAETNTLHLSIDKVKLSFISHQYPLIAPLQDNEGIRMLSPLDIGAMKLNAIVDNGTRLKDFVDMFFLLEHHSLGQLTKAYAEKYPNAIPNLARYSLLYHKGIEFNNRIDLINAKYRWPQMVKRFKEAAAHSERVFPQLQLDANRKRQRKRGV